jgi:hypothetical protein
MSTHEITLPEKEAEKLTQEFRRWEYWRDKLLERRIQPINGPPGSPVDTSSPHFNKRSEPRYSLVASVEIIESAGATHLNGRISEISRKGCFVDILNPVPKGTPINLMISRDSGTFMAAGKIIYVQDMMGMGIAFTEVPADQMEVLDSWLDELKG